MRILSKLKKPAFVATLAVAVPISMAALAIHASQQFVDNRKPTGSGNINQTHIVPTIVKPAHVPKIQLAILLDTSGSMSGLIDQSRQQIWQVVNEFSEAKQDGIKPILEVAVYEYGNDGLSSENGYIRKVSDLTPELDQVSEALFSLTTNGGEEYCGYVINTAVNDLKWSDAKTDIKAIFIAGNEPFTQGPVRFQDAIGRAKHKGIIVNTIHAGDHTVGINSGWKDGAVLAGGNFMSIDHNHKVAYINAPQDKRLAELNSQLNETYVPYGASGEAKAMRQSTEDSNSRSISSGLLAKRAKSKASTYYQNSSWDLVDAEENGKVKLDTLAEKELPAEMRSMNKEERKDYVAKKAEKRKQLKQEIIDLSKQREEYVRAQQLKQSKSDVNTMNEALSSAIRKQAEEKNFKLN